MVSPSWNKDTTAEEVAEHLSGEIKGKNVFLVGASLNSLGAEFLRIIAPHGAKTIWVAGRSEEKLQVAVDKAFKGVSESAKPIIHLVKIDMTLPESIREAADKVNAQGEPIDVLIQGAAVQVYHTLTLTSSGFESQMAGNHIGTFLLTSLLLPRLKQAASGSGKGARVVCVAAAGHAFSDFRWDDPFYKERPGEYEGREAYAHSKWGNVSFAQELARRLKNEDIQAYSLHPGSILTTGTLRIPRSTWVKFGAMDSEGNVNPQFGFKTLSQGVSTYFVAAFDPSIKDASGSYLSDCQIANDQVSAGITEETNKKLWGMTEEWAGIKFL